MNIKITSVFILTLLLSACATVVEMPDGSVVKTSYEWVVCPCTEISIANGTRKPILVEGDALAITLLLPGEKVEVTFRGYSNTQSEVTFFAFGIDSFGKRTGAVEYESFYLADYESRDEPFVFRNLRKPK